MRRVARRRAAGRHGLARAATMIEFAFILPIFMFLLLFSIDMGQVILMSGAMQDATFSAARTGAQLGGAGFDASTGALVCPTTGRCSAGSTYASFERTVDQIPFGSQNQVTGMSVLTGARCTASGQDDHGALRVTYSVRLVTPGLNTMLSMMKGGADRPDAPWQMSATAVARCEIVR
jgi:hypothetical protein